MHLLKQVAIEQLSRQVFFPGHVCRSTTFELFKHYFLVFAYLVVPLHLGYEGEKCQTNINECVPDPCTHGTCIDQVNDYLCTCELGYTDKNCSTEIDECSSNPCQNGAICTDLVGK